MVRAKEMAFRGAPVYVTGLSMVRAKEMAAPGRYPSRNPSRRHMHPHRLTLYQEADRQTSALADATGLACPPGCGVCCDHHNPHVTEADMGPIARHLVATGGGEAVHVRAVAAVGQPCVFFAPGRLPGGCTQYELRPLLCRLFGFAAVRDKHGQPALAVCHVHTAETPAVAAAAAAHVAAGGDVAVFTDLQAPADALEPDRSRVRVPINAALASALERELLRATYTEG